MIYPECLVGVGLGAGSEEDGVKGEVDEALGVYLHFVAVGQLCLVGEAAQDLLEEAVDGGYLEVGVVVEDFAQQCAGGSGNLGVGGGELLAEVGKVVYCHGIAVFVEGRVVGVGEQGEAVDETLAHLGGGTVGEGDGEQVGVCAAHLLWRAQADGAGVVVAEGKELAEVGAGQRVGLARTGRGALECEHMIQCLPKEGVSEFKISVRL